MSSTHIAPGSNTRHWTSSGLRLVGEVQGDAQRPTIVMLHGGGQTRHAWKGTSAHLADLGYRVIRFDARGHGESDWATDADYSIGAQARDLQAVIDAVEGPIALVGASMGGLTAFFAIGHGVAPRAAALVLVDVVPQPNQAGSDRVRNFMSANPAGFASLDEVADAIAAYNPNRPRPGNLAGLLKNVRRGEDGRYRWHWDPAMLKQDFKDRNLQLQAVGGRVEIPTLVLRGEKSDVVDDAGVEAMRALMPDVEVHVIAGAGHMIAGDRNDPFLDAIANFLLANFPPDLSRKQEEHARHP